MGTDRLIIYLDILGFKKLVTSDKNKLEEMIDLYIRTLTAIKDKLFTPIRIDWISDTILITLDFNKFEEGLNKKLSGNLEQDKKIDRSAPFWIGYFQVLATIQLISIFIGHPLRGFITVGEIKYRQGIGEGAGIIYGEGLIKAYNHEQIIASPTILIDQDLINKINNSNSQLKLENSRIIKADYMEYEDIKKRENTIVKEGYLIDFTQVSTDKIEDIAKQRYFFTKWKDIVQNNKNTDDKKWEWIRNFIDKSNNKDFKDAIEFIS
jgi:hypothetical protein